MDRNDIPMVTAIRDYCDEVGPHEAFDMYRNCILSVLLSEDDITAVCEDNLSEELYGIYTLVTILTMKCAWRYFAPRHLRKMLDDGHEAMARDGVTTDDIRARMRDAVEKGEQPWEQRIGEE